MNMQKLPAGLLILILIIWFPYIGQAQITSDADAIVLTEYSSGVQDNVHIFCGARGEINASLTANYPSGETGNFEWKKYNVLNGTFEMFRTDLSGSNSSTIPDLADGCYQVTITPASGVKTYTAWVFNNYLEATAEIPESDCSSFTLKGTFDGPKLEYIDFSTGQPKELNKGIQVKWSEDNIVITRVATIKIFDPPTKDTDYTFEVTDRFGCLATAEKKYISIVTKAIFSLTPDNGEAPLEVTFTNESENGDPGKFEWFIFRALDDIKAEAAANNNVVKDSIMVKLFNDSPVFTFENSGEYKVKLVSKKISEFNTCYDTTYLEGFIKADTSFIDIPNVFTPNGDGYNDDFVVKFWSMKRVKISIFNRWGKLLHVWESNNVNGFENTVDSVPQSVWDGKVGGKYCTPGVYYYTVEGIGRDNKRQRKSGFFHLFRGK